MGLLDAVREAFGAGGNGAGDDAGDASDSAAGGPARDPDDPLRRHADRWERVEGGPGRYVVFPPPDGPSSVRRCETRGEVRRRLDLWYEDWYEE